MAIHLNRGSLTCSPTLARQKEGSNPHLSGRKSEQRVRCVSLSTKGSATRGAGEQGRQNIRSLSGDCYSKGQSVEDIGTGIPACPAAVSPVLVARVTVAIVAARTSHATGAGCRMLYCLDRREATPALFAGFCPPRTGNNRWNPRISAFLGEPL